MMTRKQAREYRARIEHAAQSLPVEEAEENIMLYKQWRAGIDLVEGEIVACEKTVYRVLQGHRTQDDWKPTDTPALFAVVNGAIIKDDGEVEIDEWPAYVAPTGAHDAYNTGDKVSHNGNHWQSLVDSNVWEPDESVSTLWKLIE